MPADLETRQFNAALINAVPDQAGRPLLQEFKAYTRFLRQTYRAFVQGAEEKPILASHAAEWLLDNYYVVQQAVREIEEGLPAAYYRELPKLERGPLTGFPRVYALARQILAGVDGHLDVKEASQFINDFQEIIPLTTGELWAVPIMLRTATLENLAHALAYVNQDESLDDKNPSVPVSDSLAPDVLVGNCVLSLRTLDTQDWQAFFEGLSLVDRALTNDPARVYEKMTFDTCDRYRKAVELIARNGRGDEVAVAQTAVRLAQEEDPSSRKAHVGYFLVDDGFALLEAKCQSRPGISTRLRRWFFKRHPTFTYLGGIFSLTLALLILPLVYAFANGAGGFQLGAVLLLSLIPASAIANEIINWLISYLVDPHVLPKMDYRDGIPESVRSMVVMPAMLTSIDEVDSLLQKLELNYLRNSDPQLAFALLSDFADAPEKEMPGDEILINQARQGFDALNKRYTNTPFHFFHRERRWNEAENAWMGWERKRGKLQEFNRLLLGKGETSFTIQQGAEQNLTGIRYILTLDVDTVLPHRSAQALIGTLDHPLNRPQIDPHTSRVETGYTVIQPRIKTIPVSANASLFSRIFNEDAGFDLYTHAVSDIYQDLFHEGIFAGKGIYDLSAFEHCLAECVPENTLLSHDLFEGIMGRAALASDITLYEDYPSNYLAYTARLQRWIRGDWQLLPWLAPRVYFGSRGSVSNPLSAISYWKVVDNIRRSLVAPTLLAILAAGWLWFPGSPLIWTTLVVLVPAVSIVSYLASRLARSVKGGVEIPLLTTIRHQGVRWLLSLIFLPYETAMSLDAIFKVLVRFFITKKHLLQWTTAAHSQFDFNKRDALALFWRHLWVSPFISLVLAVLIFFINPTAFPAAVLLLLAWFAAPHIAMLISRPLDRQKENDEALSAAQERELRFLARTTWHYFEQFIGPEDHWLPPDHFQEDPRGAVAHRTSPTNIGLMLVSIMGAFDFGYVGLRDLAFYLHNCFESLDKLEQHRGHFLNWYDTRTLEPLTPRYVSTVDSGNLAAALITLRQGCLEIADLKVLRWRRWQGLLDTLNVLDEVLADAAKTAPDRAGTARLYLDQMKQVIIIGHEKREIWFDQQKLIREVQWPQLAQELVALADEEGLDLLLLNQIRRWSERIDHHLQVMMGHLVELVPWFKALHLAPAGVREAPSGSPQYLFWERVTELLPDTIGLSQITDVCQKVQSDMDDLLRQLEETAVPVDDLAAVQRWWSALSDEMDDAVDAIKDILERFETLLNWIDKKIAAMRFGFLYDRQRHIFHIGYNVDSENEDPNYYDLLASEARIASLIAIAWDDVPRRHWLHLGRPLVELNGKRVLLSWSATLFEYLMPLMFIRHYDQTLLDQSMRTAVEQQIIYGREHGVPWGISESGYYGFDAQLNYQYRAFGLPQLGLKRGLENDLVITPYASLLALPLRPKEVMANIGVLRDLKMMGEYGFYEALDFTPQRLVVGQEKAIVRSFMVHHQAMIFISLLNSLRGAPMVNRFHADRRIQSVEMLLQEHIPYNVPLAGGQETDTTPLQTVEKPEPTPPWSVPVQTPFPQAHYLSNGRYSVMITNAGAGFSRWQKTALTRWQADTTTDEWGTWIYIQDQDSGFLQSAAVRPCGVEEGWEVSFAAHEAVFRRVKHELVIRTAITVAPEEDVEIRHLHLTNQSDRPRRLRLASYGEVVLNKHEVDQRHPAFNKLFIKSRVEAGVNGVLYTRRPRSADEKPPFMIHMLVPQPGVEPTGLFEVDRERFIGRQGTLKRPLALSGSKNGLSRSPEASLDPIMSIAQDLELPAHETIEIVLITLVAPTEDEALALARRFQDWEYITRTFQQAQMRSELTLRQLELEGQKLELLQQLLSLLIYPYPALRAPAERVAANIKGQPGLWPFAISGDYPILLAQIGQEEGLILAGELLQAHAYWRKQGLLIDMVILNMEDSSYAQVLKGKLRRLLAKTESEDWVNRRGGIFLVNKDTLAAEEQTLLLTAARIVLDGRLGSLADQVQGLLSMPVRLPPLVTVRTTHDVEPTPPLPRPQDLLFDNTYGGFSADGREYVIYLEAGRQTPAPWINVIANESFGFMVSEGGSGSTWAINSGENRLTPWHNDPVRDQPGDAVYLRDEETGSVWSPSPLPAGPETPFLIRHGAGYTIFENHSQGLKQEMRLFAAPDAPLKIVHLRLENFWNRPRRITATYYAEWVLGVHRDQMQPTIVSEYEDRLQALLVRNSYNVEFGARVAFAAASIKLHGLTADRTEFLGRLGDMRQPAALRRVGLSSSVGAGMDPCAVLQVHLDIKPGEAVEVYFFMGQGADRDQAVQLIERFKEPREVAAAWQENHCCWDKLLKTVTVDTPDTAMNLLLNRWLLYQDLSCRIWGRSALYQSGGAYGFRDQLQDVLALLHTAPEIAREQLIRAAGHQFEAGDVLHWWHPPSSRGVRTRISDDLLWLPYATAQYIATTGDDAVLREQVPFLVGEPLLEDEVERYAQYAGSAETFSIYEHCCRALEKGSTAGAHGLPLMGAGDWNDGMDQVGIEGQGESVWLGWFLYATLQAFSPLCRKMGDEERAARFDRQAAELQEALAEYAWDGEWYLRAYYDDGTPLGSAQNSECKIDGIAQAWAVLSGAGELEKMQQALQAVEEWLVQDDKRLVRLFAPPFDKTKHNPGYIKGYPPGIRENGGQYTHAAVWMVWAFAELGDGDRAEALFRMLNPIYHSDEVGKVDLYQVEPYVTAADVYGEPPFTGRGGWTWYTGSGGWYYRLGVEAILGLRREGEFLRIAPCIPRRWPEFNMIYHFGAAIYYIRIENPDGVNQGVRKIVLDGITWPDGRVPLVDDGAEHEIVARLGA